MSSEQKQYWLDQESWNQEDGEHCQLCGRPYLVVWCAPDDLWQRIVGKGEAGLLCPDCFDKKCRMNGIFLTWSLEAHGK